MRVLIPLECDRETINQMDGRKTDGKKQSAHAFKHMPCAVRTWTESSTRAVSRRVDDSCISIHVAARAAQKRHEKGTKKAISFSFRLEMK